VVSAIAYTVVNVLLRAAAPSIDAQLGSLLRLVPLALFAWFMVARMGAVHYRPRHPSFLTWRLIGVLVAGGATSFVLGNILYFQALTAGGLGITISGLQAGSVLGGMALGIVLLREWPRREQWLGAALICLGLVSVAIARTQGLADLWWVGLLFAAGAGSTYAFANVCSRYVQARVPIVFVTLAGSSLGGAVPLAAMVASRVAGGEVFAVDTASLAAVLLAGVANAVALGTLAKALQLAPIASVNTINSASIVFSFLASVFVFGESGSLPMVLGIGLVTAGIVVAQVRRSAARVRGAAGGA
jgi:drug/metabolite transporter (DMT)-like permease